MCTDVLCAVISPHLLTGKKPKEPTGAPHSLSYVVEMVCSLLFALTFVSDLATKGTLHIVGDQIYGYTIVMDSVGVASWVSSLIMIRREKLNIVMHRPHGYTLTLFWIVGVVFLGLEGVSYYSPFWWWRLDSRGDIADLTIYFIRVVMLSCLVMVGLLRPLCCHSPRPTYSLLVNADQPADSAQSGTEVEKGVTSEASRRKEGDFVRTRTSSTFENMWLKVKLLFPYVWPKGVRVGRGG